MVYIFRIYVEVSANFSAYLYKAINTSSILNTQQWSVWCVENVVLFITGSMGPHCFGLVLCACVHFRWSRHHAWISQEEVWRPAHSDLHECSVSHSLHLHQDISKRPKHVLMNIKQQWCTFHWHEIYIPSKAYPHVSSNRSGSKNTKTMLVSQPNQYKLCFLLLIANQSHQGFPEFLCSVIWLRRLPYILYSTLRAL